MKKGKKALLLLLVCGLALVLMTLPAAAAGESEEVDQVAAAMFRFEEKISTTAKDADQLFCDVFEAYPVLAYYYLGCSYSTSQSGMDITVYYDHTDTDPEDIWVVSSYDQLLAALGIAMCDGRESFPMVATADYADAMVANSGAQVDLAYQQLEQEYYLIFMGYHGYSYSYTSVGNSKALSVTMELIRWDGLEKDTMFLWRNQVEQKVTELCTTTIAQDMPDAVKELIIHDWLVNNNVYDSSELEDGSTVQPDNHTAYGAFNGKCVCQGYATATHLLLKAAGIQDYVVTGTAGGAHAWNIAEIDGDWYWLDTTWDDPVTTDGSQVLSHDYFNLTDSQMLAEHTPESSDYLGTLPSCTATAMNYEAAQALLDAGTDSYTNYSTENVETQAGDRQQLLAIYGDTTLAAPADTQPAASEDTAADTAQQDDTTGGEEAAPEESSSADQDSVPAESQEPDADEDDDGLSKLLGVTSETTEDDSLPQLEHSDVILLVVILAVAAGLLILVVELKIQGRIAAERSQREEYRNAKLKSGRSVSRRKSSYGVGSRY